MLHRIAVGGPEEQERLHRQALAWRILYGHWSDDLRQRIRRDVGSQRSDAWGEPDTGANLLKSASTAVSTLYDEPAQVYHDQPGAQDALRSILDGIGWSQMMQRHQRDTIALRDTLVCVEIRDGRYLLHSVAPHEVEVIPDPAHPDQPIAVRWTRTRIVGDRSTQTVEVWDARPGRERYSMEDEQGRDLSAALLTLDGMPAPDGGWIGAAYPYRDAAGVAYIPWVAYHAAVTGRMWDYGAMLEATDGTLTVGALWTYWRHLVMTASWPQRYLIGGIAVGADQDGEGSRARTVVVADPAVLLRIVQDPEFDGQPVIHQDAASGDPHGIGDAIAAYERRIIALLGLNPADVTRISGDPRSGYAMAITRDGQREAQRRYRPIMQRWDLLLMRLLARMTGLPVDGWRIAYQSLPPTIAELRDTQAYVDAEVAAGRMSAAQAYQAMHPGLSIEDAAAAVDAISALRAPEERGGLLIGQMDAVASVARDVSAGLLPRDTGAALIRAFLAVDAITADAILGSAGMTPPPAPQTEPVPDDEEDPDDE